MSMNLSSFAFNAYWKGLNRYNQHHKLKFNYIFLAVLIVIFRDFMGKIYKDVF